MLCPLLTRSERELENVAHLCHQGGPQIAATLSHLLIVQTKPLTCSSEQEAEVEAEAFAQKRN